MTEPDRQPCRQCGRPTLPVTLRATGGYCRRCRPGQPALAEPTTDEPTTDQEPSGGAYADLARFATRELVPVFLPQLVTMLAHAERQKGSPLTPEEVYSIRDRAGAILMDRSVAEKLFESRGRDIDPENCWGEWQVLRHELLE